MVPPKIQSTNYWRLSFSLWIGFLRLTFSRVLHLSTPLKVNNDESLGRALFSGHCKKGKVLASAFLQKPAYRKISTNRLSYAPIGLFVSLSKSDAVIRSIKSGNDINFYGFAVLETEKLHGIRLDNGKSLDVYGSPSIKNPLHADIVLPAFEDKDYDLSIADQLIDISKFEAIE